MHTKPKMPTRVNGASINAEKKGDNLSYRPQYQRIADTLEDRIVRNIYKENDALPTFNALSTEFGVSLVTVNKAIQELDGRGRIIRQRGKGVFATALRKAPPEETAPAPATRTIGFVIPDLANPFYASMAKSIQEILHTADYSVITQSTDGSLSRWDQYLRRLLELRVDGIILVPLDTSRAEREKILWHLKVEGIPFVYLNSKFDRVPSDYVIADIDHGVREIARHLIEAGHRRLACISAEPCVNLTRQKMRVFLETARENGIPMSEDDIIISPLEHDEGGTEAAKRLLSRPVGERPTAIFATNDFIAFGVMAAAAEMGLTVPGDVSLVGFDNIEATRFMSPPLTTVSQPVEEMASMAAQILLQRISGSLEPDFQQHVLLPTLVERGSCAHQTPAGK